MANRKHLLIGSGPAALSALREIRRAAPEDEVKLVTMDACLPYSPASLPYLLSGRITEAGLWTRDESYFRGLGCAMVRGKEVVSVLPGERKVVYGDSSSEQYDNLLVASGAEPLRLSVRGADQAGIGGFHTLADCLRLLRDLQVARDVVVLGAGPVGMKIAGALLEKGHVVSIVERESHILPLHFDEEAETCIREVFSEKGARFLTGREAASAERKNGKTRIEFSDGSSVEADVVINATGVKGRVAFLEGAGVTMAQGILVDGRMRTGVDHIYAAGDVAEAADFFTGKHRMNAIIPNAVAQGGVAGASMAGKDAEYEGGISQTALDFFGNRAFSIGMSTTRNNPGQVLKHSDARRRRFKRLVFHGDRLVGGMFLNEVVDPGLVLHLIRRRVDMTPHKEALFEATRPLSNPWLRSLEFSPGGPKA